MGALIHKWRKHGAAVNNPRCSQPTEILQKDIYIKLTQHFRKTTFLNCQTWWRHDLGLLCSLGTYHIKHEKFYRRISSHRFETLWLFRKTMIQTNGCNKNVLTLYHLHWLGSRLKVLVINDKTFSSGALYCLYSKIFCFFDNFSAYFCM